MELAQGLLTNMPLARAKAAAVFSGIFEELEEDEFGSLVPGILKPSTFDFLLGRKE